MKKLQRLAELYPKEAEQWIKNKNENLRVAAMYESSPAHQRKAERMCRCSDWLREQVTVDPETGEVIKTTIKSASLCHLRYCPTCQGVRTRKWYAILWPVVQHVLTHLPNTHFLRLDLTGKNCPDSELRATIQAMTKAFGRLMNRNECKKVITGWIRVTEVPRGKNGDAHPHFHCLLALSPSFVGAGYIKKERFRTLWRESLQVDYNPEIFMKHIKPQEDRADILSENVSYITKSLKKIMEEDWLVPLTEQTGYLHFVVCGGRFRMVRKKMKKGKEAPVPDKKTHIATFQWNRDDKNYFHLDILYMV